MYTTTRAAVLLILLVGVLGAAPTRAETVNCTPITVLPFIITVQGIYCFTDHLATAMTSGNAIEIQTNNVVLDLNGFKLGGLAAGLGTDANGIFALDRQNLTIKNGTIRGFRKGIVLVDSGLSQFRKGIVLVDSGLSQGHVSQGHVVEDIRADQNTAVGIEVQGDGTIVRNNQVVATGGTTTLGANANAFGIVVEGNGPLVLNNDVITTMKQGTGIARGILLHPVPDGLVMHNRITDADRGIEYFGSSTGTYRDNLTFGVTTPFTGGTPVGTND